MNDSERKILIFPLSKRIGKIRRCADVYSKNDGGSYGYWQKQARYLFRSLCELGCSPDDANRHVDEFRRAVSQELTDRRQRQRAIDAERRDG